MSRKTCRWMGALAALTFGTAIAGGNTPILSGQQALRSVVVGWAVSTEMPFHIQHFSETPRRMLDEALRELSAVTTPAQLAGNPTGVLVPCIEGGSLLARMSPGPLRVLRLEWDGCARYEAYWLSRIHGPAEVIFVGNSFTPDAVLSMRFGNRVRDLVREHTPTGDSSFGGTRLRWNFRATGNFPLHGSDPVTFPYPGRYTAKINGFFESTALVPSYPNPGPPFYPYVQLFTAQGMWVSTAYSSQGEGESWGYEEDYRILAGVLTHRLQTSTTPVRPGRTIETTYRYAGLHVTRGFDAALGHDYWTLDGRVTSNLGPLYGLPGCTDAETFSYRTRRTLLTENMAYTALLADGELAVNDNVSAHFSVTGTEYGVDLLGHVRLDVRDLGSFDYTAQFSLDDLIPESGCTP